VGKGSVTRACPLSTEVVGVLERYLVSREARTGARTRGTDPVLLNTGWPR